MMFKKIALLVISFTCISGCADNSQVDTKQALPVNSATQTLQIERARLHAAMQSVGTPLEFTAQDRMAIGAEDVLAALKALRQQAKYHESNEDLTSFPIALSLNTRQGELTAFLLPVFLTSLDMRTGSGAMDVTLPKGGEPGGLLVGSVTTGNGDVIVHAGKERAILVNIKSQGTGQVRYEGPVLREGPLRADFDVVLGQGNLIVRAD